MTREICEHDNQIGFCQMCEINPVANRLAVAREHDKTCPNLDQHTPCPAGYLQWHEWAERMSKTHKSIKCAGCDRYAIWVPKKNNSPASAGGEHE